MSALNNIHLRVAPLSNRVVISRFGKDPNVALETKDVQSEFLQTIVAYMADGKMPEVGEKFSLQFGGGDEQFFLILERITPEDTPETDNTTA